MTTQQRSDVHVQPTEAALCIDDEEDQLSLRGGRRDLGLDFGGERCQIGAHIVVPLALGRVRPEPAGVDHLDQTRLAAGPLDRRIPLDDRGDPVTRDARLGRDDGDTLTGETVQQARLADVRPPHDGDLGKRHGGSMIWPGRASREARTPLGQWIREPALKHHSVPRSALPAGRPKR